MRHVLAVALLVASTIAAPAATFVRDGNRIVLTGVIRAGDAAAFAHLVASLPDNVIVVLGSDGGSVPDALAIGRLVRERKFRTLVPSQCLSACVMVWSAGSPRELGDGARIGIHCARLESDLAHCYGPATDQMAAHLRDMGMPAVVITMQAQATSPETATMVPPAVLTP